MLDPKTGRMQNRRVNVDGEAFECAPGLHDPARTRGFRRCPPARPARRRHQHDARTVPRPLRLPSVGFEVKQFAIMAAEFIFRRNFFWDKTFRPASCSMKWRAGGAQANLIYVFHRTWHCHAAPTLRPARFVGRLAMLAAVFAAQAALPRPSSKKSSAVTTALTRGTWRSTRSPKFLTGRPTPCKAASPNTRPCWPPKLRVARCRMRAARRKKWTPSLSAPAPATCVPA